MCLFYFFKRILSICSRCCEDNSETGKFMFRHNQYAAVKLRLIHYQQSRKLNNLIPFSFLTTLPYICIYETRKYREIIQIPDFNPLLFPEKCTLMDRKGRTKQINIQRAEWMLPKHMACPTSLQPPEGLQLSVGACAPAASPLQLQPPLGTRGQIKWGHCRNKVGLWYFVTLRKVKHQLWRA